MHSKEREWERERDETANERVRVRKGERRRERERDDTLFEVVLNIFSRLAEIFSPEKYEKTELKFFNYPENAICLFLKVQNF